MRAAIVYLTQARHSSYTERATQLDSLRDSLALLHRHFNARFELAWTYVPYSKRERTER